MLLCGAPDMGFGAFNQIVELVATLTVPNTNVGSYINTGWDLVSNRVGAVLACTWIKIKYRPVSATLAQTSAMGRVD